MRKKILGNFFLLTSVLVTGGVPKMLIFTFVPILSVSYGPYAMFRTCCTPVLIYQESFISVNKPYSGPDIIQ